MLMQLDGFSFCSQELRSFQCSLNRHETCFSEVIHLDKYLLFLLIHQKRTVLTVTFLLVHSSAHGKQELLMPANNIKPCLCARY